ncbi:ATP-binding protein [Pelagicoccus sp. SDUM812003]|uniref:ATP-binding protein n=1 Tax=Pelagicoccus sp. SDUM812003 TaxID=3041267 RepID=UPI0028101048|nr:ATP-binding protein [Pelagicoccus sp. SDUM812003]MDQ8204419.1 ATP-binding protein [Pelagicoccus sp. SDUM812003]
MTPTSSRVAKRSVLDAKKSKIVLLTLAAFLLALFAWAYWYLAVGRALDLARSQPIRIGYQQSPPYQIIASDGSLGGVGLDIVAEAARRLGIELEWVYSPLAPDVHLPRGDVDMWPIVTDLPHRRDDFYITKPIYENALGLLYLGERSLRDPRELKGKQVAYYDREPGITLAAKLLPGVDLMPLPSHEQAIDAVFSGASSAAFLWSTKTNSIDFKAAIDEFGKGEAFQFYYFHDETITCGIAASYQSPAAMAAADLIREEIGDLVKEGFVHETYFRYFLDPENEISSYFLVHQLERRTLGQSVAIGVLFVALAALLVMSIKLRRSREAARAASAAKSEFLAVMSHEFRTPLNGIMGMAQVAKLGELDPEQEEVFDVILQSSESMLTLVNDVLDLSKIEAGKIELEPVPMNLQSLFNTTVGFFDFLARRKGIEFSAVIDPSCPIHFIGDEARLRQILFNLVGNAVKFTSKGGVYVTASSIRTENGELLVIEVRDTGIGIEKTRYEEIFETFTQGDSSHSRKFDGTGLGLAISRKLARLMSGDIFVESSLGEGSVFSVALPLALDSRRGEDSAQSESESAFSRNLSSEERRIPSVRKVLVVDDNQINLKTCCAILEKLGIETERAADGVEAVERYEVGRFDVVLMDLQMPHMDGWEATRAIRRKEDGLGRTPIIALTAHTLQRQTIDRLEREMDGYLTKPIEIRLLARTLESIRSTERLEER